MKNYQRVISLVPSLTELVIDLELGDRLVGKTRFCIHPKEKVVQIPIVGGTKNPDLEKIFSLQPDLIIANKEENRKEDVERLQSHCEVVVTEIDSIAGALKWINRLGEILDTEEKTLQLTRKIQEELHHPTNYTEISTAYFIWKEPWISVGGDTYISDVMQHFGLKNIIDHQNRYPEITLDQLQNLSPELILLSSEPYPFKEKQKEEMQKLCPNSNVQLINGEWFSWYGSRMLQAFRGLGDWRASITKK